MSIYIDEELCKSCKLCIYFCPKDVIAISDKINSKGYKIATVMNESNCIKCKLCELNCPDLAIYVKK